MRIPYVIAGAALAVLLNSTPLSPQYGCGQSQRCPLSNVDYYECSIAADCGTASRPCEGGLVMVGCWNPDSCPCDYCHIGSGSKNGKGYVWCKGYSAGDGYLMCQDTDYCCQ